ncbi:MAG TPA: TRAP transporter small permease subunit [Longimicrobiales bacterium]|nr:TRAP transporter small permease subunit [Longimicrobiales bacterium]
MDSRTSEPALLRISAAIDRVTGFVGRAAAWLTLIMVLVGAFNAIARYLGRYIGINLSSNVYLELQWYLFSLVFLLGAAWVLREGAHVRVDVLYARVSTRAQSLINIIGTLLLLVPFSAFVLWVSAPIVSASWRIREGSPDPGGLPRYPLKALILVCFALLLLQAVSELIREVHRFRHADELDEEARNADVLRDGASHAPEGV